MKLDFDTAIFDLDGTLLDSMNVWKRVDETFFARRGITPPEGYGRALAGMSFQESACYTVETCCPNETAEAIVDEWMELVRHEYAENVQMKPGAFEYLRFLSQLGVKLCVATALPETLYYPCLERLGVADWFQSLCSTDDAGGVGKGNGDVFRLARDRAGSQNDKCVVFEDTLEGIRGAKRAGMRAVCVREIAQKSDAVEIESIADRCIDDFYDLLGDRRCVIFTARCEGDPAEAYRDKRPDDIVLSADGGWKIADSIGVKPDIVIGDFDSSEVPDSGRIVRHPVEKDDTDTMLCAKMALQMGMRDVLIIGGIGGRIDHTMANLQTLQFLARRGARCRISDGNTEILAVCNDSLTLESGKGKFAVFAVGGPAEGVTIRGGKYEAEDLLLTPDFPIAMGNDFVSRPVQISVKQGMILVTRDRYPEIS